MTPTRCIIYARPAPTTTEGPLPTPFSSGVVSPIGLRYKSHDIDQVCGMVYALSSGYLRPPRHGGFYPRPVPFSQYGNTAIFCGGINPKIHHDILKRIFGIVGELEWIQRLYDGSSAMIKFRYPLDAEKALWSLQGLVVRGRELRLNYGNPKVVRDVPATPPPSPASIISTYQHDTHSKEMTDSNSVNLSGDSTDTNTEDNTSGGGSPYRYLAELSPEFDEVVFTKWTSRECPFGAIEQPSL